MMTKKYRLGWVTDPHLNFLDLDSLNKFFELTNTMNLNAMVVTGDIAEGNNVAAYMRSWRASAHYPIFFVLGNHDYYMSSITKVRATMQESFLLDDTDTRTIQGMTKGTFWLPAEGMRDENIVSLVPGRVALVGHDGWYDGLYADWFKSRIMMSDYQVIDELKHLPMPVLLHDKLQELAEESAEFARKILPKAFETHDHVYFATHVPCWPENAVYDGKISDANWLPHFSNKHLGDAFLELMERYPDKKLTILQGHSHGYANFHPKANITSLTGYAQYYYPEVAKVFEFER